MNGVLNGGKTLRERILKISPSMEHTVPISSYKKYKIITSVSAEIT